MSKITTEKSVENLLSTYLRKNTFSACAAAYSELNRNGFFRKKYFYGKTDIDDESSSVNEKTLFDVASLTKPLVTLSSLLVLLAEERLGFDTRMTDIIGEIVPNEKKDILLRDLIHHTSGLPAHRLYYEKLRGIEEKEKLHTVVDLILRENLESRPGQRYIYSDLDYILLGYIVEFTTGKSLAAYWQEKICKPLAIDGDVFLYGHQKKDLLKQDFAVTGSCPWSGTKLEGEVHDDNCRALGRLSGHAGLFATLRGIHILCENILQTYLGIGKHYLFRREDLLYLVKKRGFEQWACGFDVPTGKKPSCGQYFSKKTIGHLGFTGTSFWLDLEKERLVVVLTNRVICGEGHEKIREMRPLLHDVLLSVSG